MTVKLHIHSGHSLPRLRITPDMELGHLYTDCPDDQELHEAAESLGLKRAWFQTDPDLPHYDLWKAPLQTARGRFPIVSDLQMADDIIARRTA